MSSASSCETMKESGLSSPNVSSGKLATPKPFARSASPETSITGKAPVVSRTSKDDTTRSARLCSSSGTRTVQEVSRYASHPGPHQSGTSRALQTSTSPSDERTVATGSRPSTYRATMPRDGGRTRCGLDPPVEVYTTSGWMPRRRGSSAIGYTSVASDPSGKITGIRRRSPVALGRREEGLGLEHLASRVGSSIGGWVVDEHPAFERFELHPVQIRRDKDDIAGRRRFVYPTAPTDRVARERHRDPVPRVLVRREFDRLAAELTEHRARRRDAHRPAFREREWDPLQGTPGVVDRVVCSARLVVVPRDQLAVQPLGRHRLR